MDTIWVLKRSTDLLTFTEIFRLDGPSQTLSIHPNVSYEFTPSLNATNNGLTSLS
ncbi:hypothetical protein [Haloferula sp.]|uniref:hypothetical protein n=1 Tax=Haloferula sp. TaxID=2497595 RepID=UPI00329C9AAC